MTDRQATVLDLEGVRVGYGATFQLSNLSFSVTAGSVVGLIGPNGGGKSTVLKSIAGVLRPQAGRILLEGSSLRRQQHRIAFVPQREEVNWEFPVTAHDVVLMGRYRQAGWLRLPSRGDRRLASDALERMGLGGLGSRHISQFSGGQQQRIFLARALAQDPCVVLLDEPFTGIDAENRAILHEIIRGFSREGVIVLMATHDLDEFAATCSHVCFLNRRMVAFGPVSSTFSAANLKATFGGQIAVIAEDANSREPAEVSG